MLAAGINNTDINTRQGWYADGGWNAPTPFPLIQGADCCGRVVELGTGVDSRILDQRVLVRACMRPLGFSSPHTRWLGTDFNGAFAQFVVVPASEVFVVRSSWSDRNWHRCHAQQRPQRTSLQRAHVGTNDRVLISGASGGVGSAAVQLAKRRGAVVTAITTADKRDQVALLGADKVLDRESQSPQPRSADVVVDNVGGAGFATMLTCLERGGRYVSSGAIAGPLVSLDMRTMYLNDLTLLGSTAWDEVVFGNVISYIEHNEIQPVVARVFGLEEIVAAQQAFVAKHHVGKLVLVPASR